MDHIRSSSLVHWSGHAIVENHQVGEAGLVLGETILAVSSHTRGWLGEALGEAGDDTGLGAKVFAPF